MWTMPPLEVFYTLKMPQKEIDTMKDCWCQFKRNCHSAGALFFTCGMIWVRRNRGEQNASVAFDAFDADSKKWLLMLQKQLDDWYMNLDVANQKKYRTLLELSSCLQNLTFGLLY